MNKVINAFCISIRVSNIKMWICKNQCITNSMMLHSFGDNARILSVNWSSENMLSHALLSSLFFSHGFIQIRFGLFEFFCFYFKSNNYYLSKFNAKFSLPEDIFLCKLNFYYWWQTYAIKFRYWRKSISWKYFMFHEMTQKPGPPKPGGGGYGGTGPPVLN